MKHTGILVKKVKDEACTQILANRMKDEAYTRPLPRAPEFPKVKVRDLGGSQLAIGT